jgi:GDP-L-fucose synthase
MQYDKVLVTGGSGFVGKRLQKIRPQWDYVNSDDANLANMDECCELLIKYRPDAVIHLAAKVGGIKENAENPASFFLQNISMNTNIVEACYKMGVRRLLSALSTCAFPDVVSSYPFTESAILEGPPAIANLPYGFSKRALWVQTKAYREQYGLNYSTFCPSNLYGPEDNFDLESSHFVAAIVRKLHEVEDGGNVEVWGTGKPLRQQLYVDDLAHIIPELLTNHNSESPMIIAPKENLSITDLVWWTAAASQKDVSITYTGALDGQHRKDGDNTLFRKTFPEFKFTSFINGIKKTYEWYNENSIYNRN